LCVLKYVVTFLIIWFVEIFIDFGSVKVGERCSSMKYVDKTFIDDEGFMGK